MRISRFYCAKHLGVNERVILDKEAHHYLKNVLRHNVGDSLHVFNGQDGEFAAEITKMSKSIVQIQLSGKVRDVEEKPVDLHLGQALVRGEKMDLVIQKATELGVSTITPLMTEFSGVKLPQERLLKKYVHWNNIAVHACEQSGRCRLPEILPAQKLDSWLSERNEDLRLVCDPDAQQLSTQQAPKSIAIMIGPEGGWSAEEVSLAKSADFVEFNLGPRILRTETAPIVALSLLQFRFGDMK